MRLMSHIKLAAFTGLITGIIFGIIDLILVTISLNFEWIVFYQIVLLSALFFIFGFVILSLFVESLKKILKLNISQETLPVFYALTAASLLLFFFGEIFINNYLFSLHAFFKSPERIISTFTLPLILIALFIFLLAERKEKISLVLSVLNKKKIRSFFSNFVFIMAAFILFSLSIDIYSLNFASVSAPDSVSDANLSDYPNILLITLDTLRADHLPVYGYPLNTSPNLNKIAEKSVIFENAVSQSSWTLPSHSSIFTGKYPSNHKAIMTHQKLNQEETTLTEILNTKGFYTAGFIGGPYCQSRYGIGQGFMTYRDRLDFWNYIPIFDSLRFRLIIDWFSPNLNRILGIDNEKTSTEINKEVFKWLEKNKDQTFFMFINYFDPHSPYNLGSKFKKYFTTNTMSYYYVDSAFSIKRNEDFPEDVIDYMLKLYDTEIFYLDLNLGKLFNKLDEFGIKNNTIIIITADHGEEFYEHGRFSHDNTLYEEIIHVPLIIYYPKELKAQRVKKRIGLINIFPTVLDMLQMEIPEGIDGVSILPLMDDNKYSEYNRDHVLSELFGRPKIEETKSQIAVSQENWKLLDITQWESTAHGDESIPSGLFNIKTDSAEKKNLYDINLEKRELLQSYIKNKT